MEHTSHSAPLVALARFSAGLVKCNFESTRISTPITPGFSKSFHRNSQLFTAYPKPQPRFLLEPREFIRHSACNATVEAKRDASQGRIRRRRCKPGFPALARVALPHGVRRLCNWTAMCKATTLGDALGWHIAFRWCTAAGKPWVPQQPAASPLRQPEMQARRSACARTSGRVPARAQCCAGPDE